MATAAPPTPPRLPNIPPLNPADPKSSTVGDPTLQWLSEALAEAEAFLQAQPGYDQIGAAIDAIMSVDETTSKFDLKAVLSSTRTNRIAKISEDLAAMLTDTKPFWDYSVANRRFEQHASIYGKLATFWYQRRNVDLRLADAIKYYLVGGTGYLHLFWNPDMEDIDAIAEDPRNVLPIRPLGYESCESCLGVIVKRKVPINYIRDKYGLDIKSESDGSSITWLNKMRDSAADVLSPIWRFRNNAKSSDTELPRIPTATLYTCYLKDDRRNTRKDMRESFTNKPLYLGEWAKDEVTGEYKAQNNWSYKVEVGEALYPNRRMIVWVANHKLYDGPSYYWHAHFPVLKLTLNPQPWSWLGKAPVHDLLRLQTSLNRLLRVVDDHASQVAQPGSIHDKNSVSRADYNAFDTRRSGWKLYQNPLAGKGIQIVTPPPLDQAIWAHIKWIQDEMKELSGAADLSQLMTLKQIPSNDSVEAIMHSMTPALRFRSRILEAFTRELAMQLAYNFSQFYTLPMRVVELGPGGVTQDDFDFDPGSMLPDYVHDKDYNATTGELTPEALLRGPLPRWDRSKEFLRRFVFKISPGSWLNSAQIEQKMIYLQLARAGWMDIFTLWEILGIPNIGVLPDNVRTIPERLLYQEQLGLNGQVNAAGRKASGQSPPRAVVKES
jgi:hypothetical protein